jgi:hypothetical protein
VPVLPRPIEAGEANTNSVRILRPVQTFFFFQKLRKVRYDQPWAVLPLRKDTDLLSHCMSILARRSGVQTVRKIYESLPKVIRVPDALKNRRVEVILLPLDDTETMTPGSKKGKNPIEEFMGAWKGKPLVRPEQGEYETRERLQ